MFEKEADRISTHPIYMRLKSTRRRLAFLFTGACLMLCAIYILLVVFAPAQLAMAPGGGLSIGLVFGIGLLGFSWALTGAYIVVANGRLDSLRDTLLAEVSK